MKNIKYILGFFLALVFFTSCEEKEYEFGDIIAPSNVVITAEIIGQDLTDPELMYGDGSGKVKFTVSADNAITYQIYFGDGKDDLAPIGEYTKQYTSPGVNTYVATASAVGTGGVTSNSSIEIEVYSAFSDVDTENLLSGANVGDSTKWYWAADLPLHVGMGTAFDDYGSGEFAFESWWSGIGAWDEEKGCMYDDEFVFTRTEEGITFEQTAGLAFVPGTYAGYIGVDGDQCHDETVATTMYGEKTVAFLPSTSRAALEGTYDEEPYLGTSFEISDGGFMGWYVGSSTYDIISIDENYMRVRIIENTATGSGAAWYQLFTSTKPVQETESLVWSDEFDTDGAPDSANWTYDLGDGGWGNGEAQTYTDNAENVIVEDGVLKITAKADGDGGYTSARLKSQGLQSFKYGRVEVKAKLPSVEGTWPAIWMLGDSFDTVGWPKCGEIDIMEQTGADKATTLGTLHWWDEASSSNASYGTNTTVENASTEFHVYSLDWDETSVKIYVDDVEFFAMDNNEDLPFNDNFFMIFNIAMGGSLGGDIDAAFTEDSMEIDYIRVYQ
ncbi:glycoside hydrolase family 16 protein [Lutibacter sp. TH_r2]|uniref:glycoside hydrolase family 16 protein n=1 Tax=Lutibacter sp. TH_r2 TaxID=3082083 RepID=UPI0029547C34|nr:glycoside hydrolase family 16 protein [Lutibacter sp. TH_r2]MDV7186052.1 glycoside hydrolase family 16 protein [Lutibacter sp. TH_r2]